MSYYLDLLAPDTYEAFGRSDRTVTGFRPRQRDLAHRVNPGDKLICYMTWLSRWIGVLEINSGPFHDSAPIFYPEAHPFTLRFKVRAVVWLPLQETVPIHEPSVWQELSLIRALNPSSTASTGRVRGSLARLSDADGEFLESLLKQQATAGRDYPVDEGEHRRLLAHSVRRPERDVVVTVPDDGDSLVPTPTSAAGADVRESIQVQALLAEIGNRMGMQIWVPRADRAGVLSEWRGEQAPGLERLPLNDDDATLRTIEQIDVLWLKGRSIIRAFEVEHTTSVYSGILRMADLPALQPNMDIRLHVVAPSMRREKVFQEIRRPVLSLLGRGPRSESCTLLSCDSVRELAEQEHLEHLVDTVLDEYAEEADD
ncbi:MAG TPA: hypothetical protein VNK43_02305 [Gemmatimonadales bacterium]|nr:hypothetical protein [Gemmatimonadales bacterium]